MALFTDADIVTLDDLLAYENSLVQVSSTHSIDVATKINLAISAVGDKLLLWLLKVRAADPQWLSRRQLGLSTVVVTPVLQRWLCFDSLSRFYEEAYNVQLNTRFQGKQTEYQKLAGEAAEMTFMSGLGIVYTPLPKPAIPTVTVLAGTSTAEGVFVQSSWADSTGGESALSPVNGTILAAGSSFSVSTAGAPAAATGWNIYASTDQNNITRQNNEPLPLGSIWSLPYAGLVAGPEPIDGQQPNFYVMMSRRLERG